MEFARAFIVFITIFIAVGILWVQTGGPERESAREPFIRFQSGTFGNYSIGPPPPIIVAGGVGTTTTYQDDDDLAEFPIVGERSPFRNTVEIVHNSYGPSLFAASEEYVELQASYANTAPVSITGWKVQSPVSKQSVNIPLGTKVFRSGIVNSTETITLEPGERAVIATGRSPVGVSFKLNACTGYLEQFQNFVPTIPTTCPLPRNEIGDSLFAFETLGGDCIDYVERLPQCQMHIAQIPPQLSLACNEFITESLNYTGCVDLHRDDANFDGTEWRVYLGQSNGLWKERRDIITLLDNNNRIVDTYSY